MDLALIRLSWIWIWILDPHLDCLTLSYSGCSLKRSLARCYLNLNLPRKSRPHPLRAADYNCSLARFYLNLNLPQKSGLRFWCLLHTKTSDFLLQHSNIWPLMTFQFPCLRSVQGICFFMEMKGLRQTSFDVLRKTSNTFEENEWEI